MITAYNHNRGEHIISVNTFEALILKFNTIFEIKYNIISLVINDRVCTYGQGFINLTSGDNGIQSAPFSLWLVPDTTQDFDLSKYLESKPSKHLDSQITAICALICYVSRGGNTGGRPILETIKSMYTDLLKPEMYKLSEVYNDCMGKIDILNDSDIIQNYVESTPDFDPLSESFGDAILSEFGYTLSASSENTVYQKEYRGTTLNICGDAYNDRVRALAPHWPTISLEYSTALEGSNKGSKTLSYGDEDIIKNVYKLTQPSKPDIYIGTEMEYSSWDSSEVKVFELNPPQNVTVDIWSNDNASFRVLDEDSIKPIYWYHNDEM